MAPHSSTLAWKIPWMEKPGRLQSMGSLRVGHDWATSLSFFTFMHWRRRLHFHFSLSCIGEGNGNPLQCSCLENPRDGGAWWASIYGVAQSRTRLKRLSSSSSGKESTSQCRRHKRFRFNPWVRKIPWSRKWQPTPVFLPGKFHGQRSLWATVHGVPKSQTRLKWLRTHARYTSTFFVPFFCFQLISYVFNHFKNDYK